MLKTWWFEGAAPGFRLPAARSARGPTVHYNRAMITPTLLRRFSVPPQLSCSPLATQQACDCTSSARPFTFCLAQPLSLHHCLPHVAPCHTTPTLFRPMWGNVFQMRRKCRTAGQTDVPLQKRVNDLTKKTWLWFLISWFLLVWQLNGLKHIFKN